MMVAGAFWETGVFAQTETRSVSAICGFIIWKVFTEGSCLGPKWILRVILIVNTVLPMFLFLRLQCADLKENLT